MRLRSFLSQVQLLERQINQRCKKTGLDQKEIRKLIRQAKDSKPEQRKIKRKYGRTLEELQNVDKEIKGFRKHIREIEKESGLSVLALVH